MLNIEDVEEIVRINGCFDDYEHRLALEDRRSYLHGEISSLSGCDDGFLEKSATASIVDSILDYNRMDRGLAPANRKPIRLYINSPGGEIFEGFPLVSAIELSKTPVYTINVGCWCSMAFLIGITGHRRFSLPNTIFLMHDGTNFAFDSGNKAQDKMEFDKRYQKEVIKNHILKHSNMKPVDYDALARVEYYMLPEDALERSFIDEIVTDIDTIL